MVRHNNTIPNGHFHKKWQRHAKTWFSQPMEKAKRKRIRARKCTRIAPKPVELLRPFVHCPTVRYNRKLRAGRGFTFQELKKAGLNRRFVKTIGICVDHRRRNRCLESLSRNAERLKEYKSRLILFPVRGGLSVAADRGTDLNRVKNKKVVAEKGRIVEEDEKKFEAFTTLRRARSDAKYAGIRLKRKLPKMEVPL